MVTMHFAFFSFARNPEFEDADDAAKDKEVHELPCMDCGKKQEYKGQVGGSVWQNSMTVRDFLWEKIGNYRWVESLSEI